MRVKGSGFRVEGSGFRVQVSGRRVKPAPGRRGGREATMRPPSPVERVFERETTGYEPSPCTPPYSGRCSVYVTARRLPGRIQYRFRATTITTRVGDTRESQALVSYYWDGTEATTRPPSPVKFGECINTSGEREMRERESLQREKQLRALGTPRPTPYTRLYGWA